MRRQKENAALALAEYYNMSVEELVGGEDYYDKEF